MNYNKSNTLLYGKQKAKISLKDYMIALDLGEDVKLLEEATVVADLMSIEEVKRYEALDSEARRQVSDAIALEKIIEVVGWSSYPILFNYSHAGVSHMIVESIYLKSVQYLSNTIEVFSSYIESEVSLYEQMAAVASHYLNIPFTEVINYPVHEILRLYAICFKAFPGLVDLRPEEEE